MRQWLLLPFIVVFYLFNIGTVYGFSLELVDQLDIKAIKSIHLKKTEQEFRADVVVQFSTFANAAMKFRQADFIIIFKDEKGKDIYLGTTHSDEILFPSSNNGTEKLIEIKLDVYVGKNNIKTLTRLIEMFNLIGNPDSEFTMILSGTTEVGTKAKRGWIYQGRVGIEDFTFHPTIQREVLFK
jgi:hypothetical protein